MIEPNENLSRRYMEEANQTLDSLENVDGKWRIIMGYYACYHALYSILMRIGIKCEIHECTLLLMHSIPGFQQGHIEFIQQLKEDRIAVQYYLKEKKITDTKDIRGFIATCKGIREGIDAERIRRLLSHEN